MDGLKLLVAAACIAIITAVAHYFWSDYSERQARRTAADEYNAQMQAIARRKETEKALYASAFADPWDKARVREYCSRMVKIENDATKPTTRSCIELGYYP